MASRGCDLGEEELAELEEAETRRSSHAHAAHGTPPVSGDGACDGSGGCGRSGDDAKGSSCGAAGVSRPGDGLTRDEKRGVGSWAARSAPATGPRTCYKCKTAEATVIVNREGSCVDCMENSVMGKVRAVKQKGGLARGDRVLVAVSGGPASLLLLRCLDAMRAPEGSAHPGKGRLPFGIMAVHVQQVSTLELKEEQALAHAQLVEAAVRSTGFDGQVHIVPLHDVYSSPQQDATGPQQDAAGPQQDATGSQQGATGLQQDATGPQQDATGPQQGATGRADRLRSLLQAATDPTGREDLEAHLLNMMLQSVAATHACNKIVLGDTATSLAARVVAEAAKGRGYALPGNLQLLDARHATDGGASLLRPLRDVSTKEVALLCRARGVVCAPPLSLPQKAGAGGQASVNQLAVAFMAGLQAHLASTSSTVLRTAQTLRPFVWNELCTGAVDGVGGSGRTVGDRSGRGGRADGGLAPGPRGDNVASSSLCAGSGGGDGGLGEGARGRALCVVCSCPLAPPEAAALRGAVAAAAAAAAETAAGSSDAAAAAVAAAAAAVAAEAAAGSPEAAPAAAAAAAAVAEAPPEAAELCGAVAAEAENASVGRAEAGAGAAPGRSGAEAAGGAAAGAASGSGGAATSPVPLRAGCCTSCASQILAPLAAHVAARAGGGRQGQQQGILERGQAQGLDAAMLALLPEAVAERLAALSCS
ncbi:hypothetical protein FOA52_007419 [Chlamydomonas sp. UWO 241]|nr:hypothetical protein FOA52_007419 [Chlamydomonas sp. UWO 241]